MEPESRDGGDASGTFKSGMIAEQTQATVGI